MASEELLLVDLLGLLMMLLTQVLGLDTRSIQAPADGSAIC